MSGGLNLGFWGFIHVLLCLWAAIHILQSHAKPMGKAFWIALIAFMPVFGMIIWFFAGPRAIRPLR